MYRQALVISLHSSASIGSISTHSQPICRTTRERRQASPESNALMICGKLAELAKALALRDAFGAEADRDRFIQSAQDGLHQLADAGKDGAAEDQNLPIAQIAVCTGRWP